MTIYRILIDASILFLRERLRALARKCGHARVVSHDLESASHQLDDFRSMYEQEVISQKEFDRLRGILGDQQRRAPRPQAQLPKTVPTSAVNSPDSGDDFLGIWRTCIRNSTPGHPARLEDLTVRTWQSEYRAFHVT
jgi:hypothetical protein